MLGGVSARKNKENTAVRFPNNSASLLVSLLRVGGGCKRAPAYLKKERELSSVLYLHLCETDERFRLIYYSKSLGLFGIE